MSTPAKLAACIVLAAGIFVAGYMANRQLVPAASSDGATQALRYTCPMHPQYISDRTGECPICGMRLTPLAEGKNQSDVSESETPGMVRIGTEKQQLIGIRTDEVRKAPVAHDLRVPGRITVD